MATTTAGTPPGTPDTPDTPDTPLNPYALLGVTVGSTCQEVRRAYYELAMHAHPDRGGSADQMRVVQAAYEYVMRQVAEVDRSKPTVELYQNAEDEFKRFCEDQVSNKPPCFSDVFAEAHGKPTFNQLWEEAQALGLGEDLDPAAHHGGYGHLMAAPTKELGEYEPVVAHSESLSVPKTVALYVEPEALVKPSDLYRDLTVHCTHPVLDYSTAGLSDYQTAFAPVLPADIPARQETDLTDEGLEDLRASRATAA